MEHKALEQLRVIAVKRVIEGGERPSSVVTSLGLCRTSIYPWLRDYHAKGWDGLTGTVATGRISKLTERQKRQVKRWIIGKDPRQYGFDFGLWTRKIVKTLIHDRMEIDLGLTAVGRLLAQMNITPQKPLRRAYERDPEQVAKWLEETCVFRRLPDTDSDFSRTAFRRLSDRVPILTGQGSGGVRTAFRFWPDRVPIQFGQPSGAIRTVGSPP